MPLAPPDDSFWARSRRQVAGQSVLPVAAVGKSTHLFFNDDYAISILPVLTDMARSWREGSLAAAQPLRLGLRQPGG